MLHFFFIRAVRKRRPQSGGFVQCEKFAIKVGGGSSDADFLRNVRTFLRK